MKEKINNGVVNIFNTAQFKVKKYSPEILLTVGVVGTVVGTVLACKATPKVKDILEEKDSMMTNVDIALEDSNVEYTEEDAKKDTVIIYTQTGLKLAKNYAPAVGVMTMSLLSIITGHKILNKRNAAIAAAYAVVDTSFKKYRKNVIDKFGEEIDQELRYSIVKTEENIKDKDGKKKKETVEHIILDEAGEYSEYARFFDDGQEGWSKDPEYNLMYLRRQQDYANEMLKSRGHLFLNEVYDLLDIPRSKAGQVVGWIYDEKNPMGDNYIDFNIYDSSKKSARRFVNGLERTILLDFNVDGVIYDII